MEKEEKGYYETLRGRLEMEALHHRLSRETHHLAFTNAIGVVAVFTLLAVLFILYTALL